MASLRVLVLFLASLLCPSSAQPLLKVSAAAAAPIRRIGYYDAGSQEVLPVEDIPYTKLTHIVVTNALTIDNGGSLHVTEHGDVSSRGSLPTEVLVSKLAQLPVKVVLSVRGQPDDVAFDEVAEEEHARRKFVADLSALLRSWGVAGVEIDWHGADPAGGKARDQPFDEAEQYHMALLCRDLAASLRAMGGMTLSVSVYPGQEEFRDAAFISNNIDWLAVQAYSMRTLGDPHHASMRDMKSALAAWGALGVPRSQIVLGTPLFARAGMALSTTRGEERAMSWRDLMAAGLRPGRGGSGAGDLFLDPSTGKAWWVSGKNTTIAKAQLVLLEGYGGIAVRDMHQDALAPNSLLEAAVEVIKNGRSALRRARTTSVPPMLIQNGFQRSRTDEL